MIAGTLRIAIKDNIDVVGWPTRAGSKAISREPASRDAVVVTRLREAGILIGSKTRMDEFAMTTSGPGMRNPADHSRSAGGSSGGSAIAVAVGGYCAALGTDTGGSSRVPAAYCGVVGFKPTFGGVPTDGVVPLSPSLDHVGILGCSVSAVREVFRVVGNAEDRSEVRPWGTSRRLGIPRDSYLAAASIEVRRAFARTVDRLRQQGWETVEVDLPSPQLV
ncbi:MAG: amidase, partial [Pseudolysinimonas sp.]